MRSIEEILGLESGGVLSLVGAGGKTSLMFHLARLLSRAGKRVLTTTTTKIQFPTPDQSQTVLIAPDPETILSQAWDLRDTTCHLSAAAAQLSDIGKLQGFAPAAISSFRESGLFDWILVEADGAARRPLKAPAGHEPVLPLETTVLVAVAGLEVIGAPLSEELVFRSELAGPLMNLSPGETITEQALARLLAHPSGAFKDAPPLARRFIFLNKADSPARRAAGSEVAQQLRLQARPVAESLLVGQALDGIRIHFEIPLGAAR